MPLNTKSPGVRRILEEAKEIQSDPSIDFVASPSEVSPPLRPVSNSRKTCLTGNLPASAKLGFLFRITRVFFIGISRYEDLRDRILKEGGFMDGLRCLLSIHLSRLVLDSVMLTDGSRFVPL